MIQKNNDLCKISNFFFGFGVWNCVRGGEDIKPPAQLNSYHKTERQISLCKCVWIKGCLYGQLQDLVVKSCSQAI